MILWLTFKLGPSVCESANSASQNLVAASPEESSLGRFMRQIIDRGHGLETSWYCSCLSANLFSRCPVGMPSKMKCQQRYRTFSSSDIIETDITGSWPPMTPFSMTLVSMRARVFCNANFPLSQRFFSCSNLRRSFASSLATSFRSFSSCLQK